MPLIVKRLWGALTTEWILGYKKSVVGGWLYGKKTNPFQPGFCSSKICLRLTQNTAHFGQG